MRQPVHTRQTGCRCKYAAFCECRLGFPFRDTLASLGHTTVLEIRMFMRKAGFSGSHNLLGAGLVEHVPKRQRRFAMPSNWWVSPSMSKVNRHKDVGMSARLCPTNAVGQLNHYGFRHAEVQVGDGQG